MLPIFQKTLRGCISQQKIIFDQIRRISSTSIKFDRKLNEPISPHDLHRAGGIATFMRLPYALNHEQVLREHS